MDRRTTEAADVGLLIEQWVSAGMRVFDVKRDPESDGAVAFTSILALGMQDQLQALRLTVTEFAESSERRVGPQYDREASRRSVAAAELITALGRRSLPVDDRDLIHILEGMHRHPHLNSRSAPLKPVLKLCERGLDGRAPTGVLEHLLKRLRDQLVRNDFADERALIARIDRLLESEPMLVLDDRDVWAKTALEFLATLPDDKRRKWQALFAHASASKSATPTAKWRTTANRLVDGIGERDVVAVLLDWFSMVDLVGYGPRGEGSHDDRELPHGQNAEVLRGLASCCIGIDDPELALALGDMAAASYEEVPKHGRRCVGVGNACVVALGSMAGTEATTQLERLRRDAGMPNVERMIDTVLERRANSGTRPQEQ